VAWLFSAINMPKADSEPLAFRRHSVYSVIVVCRVTLALALLDLFGLLYAHACVDVPTKSFDRILYIDVCTRAKQPRLRIQLSRTQYRGEPRVGI
jgi:hypothetical protein